MFELIKKNTQKLYSEDNFVTSNDVDKLRSNQFQINIYGHELVQIKSNDDENVIKGLRVQFNQWSNGTNCCTGLTNQDFHSFPRIIQKEFTASRIDDESQHVYPLDISVLPPAGPHQNETYRNQYDYIPRNILGICWQSTKEKVKNEFNINIDYHDPAHCVFSKYVTSKICIYAPPFSGKTSLVSDLRNHGIPATETDIAPTFNTSFLDIVLLTNNPVYLNQSEITIAIIPTFCEYSRRLGLRKLTNDKEAYLKTLKKIPSNTNILFSDDYIGELVKLTKSHSNRAKLIIKNDSNQIGNDWYWTKDSEIKHELYSSK